MCLFSLRELRACLFALLIMDFVYLVFCKMPTILFLNLLAASSSGWPFSWFSCWQTTSVTMTISLMGTCSGAIEKFKLLAWTPISVSVVFYLESTLTHLFIWVPARYIPSLSFSFSLFVLSWSDESWLICNCFDLLNAVPPNSAHAQWPCLGWHTHISTAITTSGTPWWCQAASWRNRGGKFFYLNFKISDKTIIFWIINDYLTAESLHP